MRKASSLLVLLSVAALSACGGGQANPPPMPTKAQSQGQASVARVVQSHAKAASGGYSLFGDATLVSPGNASPTAVLASWDASAGANGAYGGIDFAVPAGMTFSQLTNLSSDYRITQGVCGQGSPRFAVELTDGVNDGYAVFIFGGSELGQSCPQNVWTNTTNMASDAYPVDTSQRASSTKPGLPGGALVDTYAAAEAKYGSYAVVDLFIVVDGFSTPIYAQFDNTRINNTTYTYETSNSCKNGGWQQFTASPGPFKNQGDCVSYFATGGKNGSGG